MSNLIEITDVNFDEKVIYEETFILFFYAEWNGSSKMMKHVFENLSGEFEGKTKIGILDVDNNQITPLKYGLKVIPTIISFRNGEKEKAITGSQSISRIRDFIEEILY